STQIPLKDKTNSNVLFHHKKQEVGLEIVFYSRLPSSFLNFVKNLFYVCLQTIYAACLATGENWFGKCLAQSVGRCCNCLQRYNNWRRLYLGFWRFARRS